MRTLIRSAVLMLSICFSSTLSVRAIEPVNPNLSPEARKVLDYLESVYQKRVLAGYNVYVHTPDDYEQTGKEAVVWGRDIRWLGDPQEIAEHAKRNGYLLTLHWHWHFDEDSAWGGRREKPVDVGRLVTPGTPEHAQAMKEIAAAADKLQVLEDAGIPILWRPLHEIDGGWFWWTDKETPENTAALWRMIFDYMVKERKLDNLIWVYNAGVGKKKTVEYRKRFYPGADYVDISGIDIYGVDFKVADEKYREYFDDMQQVSPGKMLAMSEGDAIPNPKLMESGELPRWLYVLPWWGTPSSRRPVDWAMKTMRDDFIVTLDETPAIWGDDLVPQVGILQPIDDGSAWTRSRRMKIEAYAVDRDGKIDRVEFYCGDRKIGEATDPPYDLQWTSDRAGCYDLTAVAIDDDGNKTTSNNIRVGVGVFDAARNRPVVASSGKTPEAAVDGDYFTHWSADKESGEQWLYVDLGETRRIDQANLLWGWKIHPELFAVDVAVSDPRSESSWREVALIEDREYVPWEATDRVEFEPVPARFVRVRAMKRASHQTWSGYQLTALEVPIPSQE